MTRWRWCAVLFGAVAVVAVALVAYAQAPVLWVVPAAVAVGVLGRLLCR